MRLRRAQIEERKEGKRDVIIIPSSSISADQREEKEGEVRRGCPLDYIAGKKGTFYSLSNPAEKEGDPVVI